MSYWKRIWSLAMALVLFASLALPAVAYGNEYLNITAGQTVTPRVTDEECLLKFTPEADGWYAFWSVSTGMDPNGRLWNDEIELRNDHYGEGYDFLIQAYLTAGETYYLRAGWDWDPGSSLELHMDLMVSARTLTLDTDAINGYQGERYLLEYTFRPLLAIPEEVTWHSSNEAVATVDEYGEVILVGTGNAIITATSKSGLTADCDLTVQEAETIVCGQPVSLSGEDDQARFRFMPEEEGWYIFYSTDATGDPDCVVLEETMDWLDANGDGPDGLNFRVRVHLRAGQVYYLQVNTGGSLNVHLEKEGTQEADPYLPGDVTGDGKVNVADTSKVYAHIRGSSLITDEYVLARADVNGDGQINVADTAMIYAHVKGTALLW